MPRFLHIEFSPHVAVAVPQAETNIAGRTVSRVLSRPKAATVIYLADALPRRSSSLPGSHDGSDQSCSHIWPCSRWGLPSQPVARLLVGSYIKGPKSPHRFTLTLSSGQSSVVSG